MSSTNMKVMIVDDELLAIEDLRTLIPWEQYDFDIVATATNGKKALELYECLKPDLIILDVRMPIMDGIELLEQLQLPLQQKQLVVILLTAYKDFEYAQKAIEYRVSNYLLKHTIDESSLLKEVLKARAEWLHEREQQKMIQSKRIGDLLDGNVDKEDRHTFGLSFDFHSVGIILLEEDRPYPLTPTGSEMMQHTTAIDEKIRIPHWHNDERIAHVELIGRRDGKCCLVVFFKHIRSQKIVLETLHRMASDVLNKFLCEHENTLTATITYTEPSGPISIHKLFHEAVQMLQYKWFAGRGKVLDCALIRNNIARSERNHINSIDHNIEHFIENIPNFDAHTIGPAVAALFDQVKTPVWCLSGLRKVTNLLIETMKTLHEMFHLPPIENMEKDGIARWFDYDELKRGFVSLFQNTYQKKPHIERSQYSYKTNQAIEYIRKHYMCDLNVSDVSEAINISPSYLHQLFKNEVQKTFLEFLTEYRIKVAKQLLQYDDYKIYEIAELTGYNTSQYFSQVFQKMTGMTPHAYKKKFTGKSNREYKLQNTNSL